MADIYKTMHARLPDSLRLRWVDMGTYWAPAYYIVGASGNVLGAVSLLAGEAHVGEIGGYGNVVTATVIRPADTTAYVVDDVLSDNTVAPTLLTFSDVARVNGESGWVISAVMVTDRAEEIRPQVRLMLFDTAPAAQNDNAQFAPTDADALRVVGWIDFNAYQDGAVNTIYFVNNLDVGFRCATGSRSMYGIPVMKNAYVPVANEKFDFRIEVTLD